LGKNKNIQNVPREMTHHQLSRFKRQQRRQRIILFSGIGIILAIILIIVGGWYAGVYMPLHQTVIQVYDKGIDTSFFIDTLVIAARNQGTSNLNMLASSITTQIEQNELIIQEAGKLGFVISDEEARQQLLLNKVPNEYINQAYIELQKNALIMNRLKNNYFGAQVPVSDNQYWVNAMYVESESVAQMIREKIIHGENFSELVKQYAMDNASKEYNGDYGEHPMGILKNKFLNTIPLDYVSRADVKTGDISPPLTDNASKKLGYWLIKVNDRQITTSSNISPQEVAEEENTLEAAANVSALFLSSLEEAESIRARLLKGEALGPIAEQYSQYNASKQGKGELGLVPASQNVSDPFNNYIFDTSVKLGEWSEPIRDETFYFTTGGCWVVQVIEKSENKTLTTEDRDKLIDDLYNSWLTKVANAAMPSMTINLNDEIVQWAVEKATEILQSEQK
jgi:hypothetical protein